MDAGHASGNGVRHCERTQDTTGASAPDYICLPILGAVLATLASQYEGGLRWWLAIVGAVVFAIATFLTSRLTDENGGWLAKWTQ
jgi:drug/metabolite transporter (DMT)-like permease